MTWLWGFHSGLPLNRAVTSLPGPPYEYRGLIHGHTTSSDGGRSVKQVAAIADRLGLDFLIVTDHNTLEGREHEGIHGRCRVLVGSEVSTDHGHLLAINTPEMVSGLGGRGLDVVREVRLLDGISVIAHPIHSKAGWHAPLTIRPDAIEVFNGDSAWRNAPLWKVLLGIAAYSLNPERAFLHTMDDAQAERALWDRYLRDGPITGLAGGDCHGRMPVGPFGVEFPKYERCLDAFQTHILTGTPLRGDFEVDRSLIVDALRRGSAYLSLGLVGPVEGFRFHAVSKGSQSPVQMGESVSSLGRVTFVAELPAEKPALVVLLRDGEIVSESRGRLLEHTDSSPGVYRVEVYADQRGTLGGRVPWVLSNPIRVERPGFLSESEQSERALGSSGAGSCE